MSLVERIQDLCSRKDTTLIGLEREIGLGRGTIRNWDKSSPSIDKLQKVASYFEISIDELVLGFNPKLLASMVNLIMHNRTFTQFVKDTGIDENELYAICSGRIVNPPSLETLGKIIGNNPINQYISPVEIITAAGYRSDDLLCIPEPILKQEMISQSNEFNLNIDMANQPEDIQLDVARIVMTEPSMIEIIKKLNNLPPEKREVVFKLIKTM